MYMWGSPTKAWWGRFLGGEGGVSGCTMQGRWWIRIGQEGGGDRVYGSGLTTRQLC